MYVGELAQSEVDALAEAYGQWVNSAWQAIRNETPPIEVVMNMAYGIAQGRTTPEKILAIIQGG